MLLVVAYDVADDRRRVRLHALLLGYGLPLQESLFACTLTDRQAAQLRQRIRRVARGAQDQVHMFQLCAECAEKVEDLAGHRLEAPQLFFV